MNTRGRIKALMGGVLVGIKCAGILRIVTGRK